MDYIICRRCLKDRRLQGDMKSSESASNSSLQDNFGCPEKDASESKCWVVLFYIKGFRNPLIYWDHCCYWKTTLNQTEQLCLQCFSSKSNQASSHIIASVLSISYKTNIWICPNWASSLTCFVHLSAYQIVRISRSPLKWTSCRSHCLKLSRSMWESVGQVNHTCSPKPWWRSQTCAVSVLKVGWTLTYRVVMTELTISKVMFLKCCVVTATGMHY